MADTVADTVNAARHMDSGIARSAEDGQSFAPRVLDLKQAADYLHVHWQTARQYIAQGLIPRICYPTQNSKRKASHDNIRKILIDRRDLDSFIEKWKSPIEEKP